MTGPIAGGSFEANVITLTEGLDLARAWLERDDDRLQQLWERSLAPGGLDPALLDADDWELLTVALAHARLATVVGYSVRLAADRS